MRPTIFQQGRDWILFICLMKKYLCIYFLKYLSTKRECNLYRRNIIYKINLRKKNQFELKRNPQKMHHDK